MKWLFLVLIFSFNLLKAEEINSNEAQSDVIRSSQNAVEFDYRLFSPEILFHIDSGLVLMTPKAAGQPGVKFHHGSLGFSINKSLFSENSQSGGFNLSYDWDNSFAEFYHAWAKGYRVQLNPNSDNKENLGDRNNMTGSHTAFYFLEGLTSLQIFH